MRANALFLAMFVATAVTARADEASIAIVKKALKASGWENRKGDHATWKDKGKFSMPGAPEAMPYEGEFHVTYPDKYRFTFKMKVATQEMDFTVVLDGDKGWEKAMGRTEPLKGEKLSYVKDELYAMYVMSMNPLLDPKAGFEMKSLGESKVNDKKCVGVEVTKKEKPAIKLFFDAETGLPAKFEYKVKNEFDAWKEATDEMYLLDWTDDGAAKSFKKFKVNRNGKTMIESDMSDYKQPEKVDAKLYEKP